MSNRKFTGALQSKQFKVLQERGLKLVSTDRQVKNGTIALAGKFKIRGKTVTPKYQVTANGAVISNEFVARRVENYRDGLAAVGELLEKRLSMASV